MCHAGHWRMVPARVSVWTATTIIRTDIATTLRLTAARTTSTANVTLTPQLGTLTPRASTSTAPMSTDVAIITLAGVNTTCTMDSATIEEAMNVIAVIVDVGCMIILIIIAIIIYFNIPLPLTGVKQLVVPRHRLTTLGRRAFAVMGPTVWNSLPDDLRAQQNSDCFCRHLKTFLFSQY